MGKIFFKILFLFLFKFTIEYELFEDILYLKQTFCEYWKDLKRHFNCYFDTDDESLLDLELVDVIIKYIDLNDKDLKRNISQIEKDVENGEIKYSTRSILQNIPWINKIYIIMPNKKVKYFKNPEEINEKIKYIEDKDLIGFDSSSSIVFEFNFWRLKKFGVTKNFLYFNDDCFIGNNLKKSDFFYQLRDENGTVVPYLTGINILNSNKTEIEEVTKKSLEIISQREKLIQDTLEYQTQTNLTKLFIYQLFGDSAKIKMNNHNANPDNLINNEEIYNIVKKYYHHPDACLNAIKREMFSLTYYVMNINYMLNKYNIRFKEMNTHFFDIMNIKNIPVKFDLFVINKSGEKKYEEENFGKSLIYLNFLFPEPTKYEKINRINGIYMIETALNENKIINFKYNEFKNKNYLLLNNKEGKNSELFEIEYQNDDGSYTIKSLSSNYFIGISDNVSIYRKEKSFSIGFYPKVEGKKQKWYFLTNKEPFYYIASADEFCALDVPWGQANDNSKIRCYTPNGTKSQMFILKNNK